MKKSLDAKLQILKNRRFDPTFILADAKDPDMAFGISGPGTTTDGKRRSVQQLRDQIREIVHQGLVDIMLMSTSTSEILTIQEKLFESSPVTPACRANDATDVHVVRSGAYLSYPSRPFATATIDHIQAGKSPCTKQERSLGASLGLYSVTFNNDTEADLRTLCEYKSFRLEAERKGFRHFLEVFSPNVVSTVHKIEKDDIAGFMNDHIVRLLAGVPSSSRPVFLKIPYLGPAALEELCAYDESILVGVLGGSSGTTYDAFCLLAEAKLHGARVALFGRKINHAEDQLEFVRHLRLIADDQISAKEAVKSYHACLTNNGLQPHRSLCDDLELTDVSLGYGS